MPKLPATTPKSFCFVLMPFSDEFHDVYNLGIKEACTKAGAYCERVDEQIFHERILDRVYNQISKADIVIADMTDRNPNVFYEVGYAHALGKLTILLTQNADDIPFDLKHFPHIVYGNKVTALRDELKKRIKYFIDHPPETPSETKTDIELFIGEHNLALENIILHTSPHSLINIEITISNVSSNTFRPEDFKVGVETNSRFPGVSTIHAKTTQLPNGNLLHLLPDFRVLLPDAYDSVDFYFLDSTNSFEFSNYITLEEGEQETIWVRLFTKQGSRKFPVTIKCH